MPPPTRPVLPPWGTSATPASAASRTSAATSSVVLGPEHGRGHAFDVTPEVDLVRGTLGRLLEHPLAPDDVATALQEAVGQG